MTGYKRYSTRSRRCGSSSHEILTRAHSSSIRAASLPFHIGKILSKQRVFVIAFIIVDRRCGSDAYGKMGGIEALLFSKWVASLLSLPDHSCFWDDALFVQVKQIVTRIVVRRSNPCVEPVVNRKGGDR